jgi:hypothetical protein
MLAFLVNIGRFQYVHRYIMHLPREFSSRCFVAVYLPPQTNAGTKTAINELYRVIDKTKNSHPEAALLVTDDFNAEN